MLRLITLSSLTIVLTASFLPRPQCPPGQTYSLRLRRCVKQQNTVCIALACPPGYIRKPPSCTCVKKTPALPKPSPPAPSPPSGCHIASCFEGYAVNDKCKCVPKSLIVCLKLCQPGFHIRPGSCVCVPKRSCQIKACKRGFKLDSRSCQCVRSYSSPPSVPPKSCGIRSCDSRYSLSLATCKCKVKFGPICKIGCPPGLRVFPGRCKCVRPPRCPIKLCRQGYYLNRTGCRCVESGYGHGYPDYGYWGSDYGDYDYYGKDLWKDYSGYSSEDNRNVIIGSHK